MLRDRYIDSWYFQIRVCWRWTISLHVHYPWGWCTTRYSHSSGEFLRQSSAFKLSVCYLIFFALKVYFTVLRHILLILMFEKGIVQYAIINIDLPHFRLNPFAHSLFQTFVCVVIFRTETIDAGVLDEFR